MRQTLDNTGAPLASANYDPWGTPQGSAISPFGFTGELQDAAGLTYLRARWYNPAASTLTTVDPFEGLPERPYTLHPYAYVLSNPTLFTDPTGQYPSAVGQASQPQQCPVGKWDCEAVGNVQKLRKAFIGSASRHNIIPGMDDSAFAGLLAAIIVSERRIGNIPTDGQPRDRQSIQLEDLLASLGCTVSGRYIQDAVNERDWNRVARYLTNQEVPGRATVGIGNMWLETAANVLRGQACSSLGDCTSVQVSPLQVTNPLGFAVNINNPFSPQVACTGLGACGTYQPSETESFVLLTHQLLNWEMNIEYIAANLEAGALRAIAKGFRPSAFNSATWHLRGVQTDEEIQRAGWNPGAAVFILDDIPTALQVLGLSSSWSTKGETQYNHWK